jgi:hypothetical protein
MDDRDLDLLPRLTIIYRREGPPPPVAPTPGPEPPPVVPEASSLLLLGSALSGLAAYAGLQIRARRG